MGRLVSVIEGSRVRLREVDAAQDPLVLAVKLQEARDRGVSVIELAQRAGRSRPWVSNMLRLLHLCPSAKAALRSGKMTVAHGKVIANLPVAEQERIVRLVVARSWSYRRTLDEAQAIRARRRRGAA